MLYKIYPNIVDIMSSNMRYNYYIKKVNQQEFQYDLKLQFAFELKKLHLSIAPNTIGYELNDNDIVKNNIIPILNSASNVREYINKHCFTLKNSNTTYIEYAIKLDFSILNQFIKVNRLSNEKKFNLNNYYTYIGITPEKF